MPSQHTFDGPTLEAVLADVADTHGAAARIVRAEKVRHGGIAGFFARERVEVSIEVDEDPPAQSREPSLDAAAVAVTSTPASLLDLVDRVSDEERAAAGAPPSGAPPSCAPPSCDDVVPSTARPSFEAVLRRVVASTGTGSSEDAVDAAATTYRPRPAPALASPHAELVALGVPAAVVAVAPPGESAAVRLLLALERLPQAPALPTPAGGVVVVVGEPAVAVLSARVAAEQLGQTDADVVVASPGRRRPERIASPADARQRRLAWRRCLAPTVVAVCTEEGLQATGWAREVLEALEPDAVWGAVPANAKPEDVAAWAGRMGGVDALAVAGCAATVTPAAVLGAGIPVAALEGRRATPAAWTALLVERLAA